MKPVILGAGLAGLSTALALAPAPVIVVSPCALGDGCSSAWAQGGIAAAVGADDKAEFHAQDTLAAGNGLNDADIVRQTTNDGAAIIDRLTKQGVVFDRDERGNLLLGLEAAHGKRRIVHVKDATGAAVMLALIKAARATPSIEIIDNARALDIVVKDGSVAGVIIRKYGIETTLHTNCVVLATGGAAALWRDTTNPHENWGSGLALAARAGATLNDLEFMQFHPTAIDIGRDPMPLASEALRGEGAVLINEKGERFTDVLQRRDIVTRAIWDQISKGHNVYLDAREALGTTFADRFPTIHATCISARIDPATRPIPVKPAAHYHMGGVRTDKNGRTDVKGLWACGEVASTGFHGANRLASNSLLEAASFGGRVAQDIKNSGILNTKERDIPATVPKERPALTPEQKNTIRKIMSDDVGVIRDKTGLLRALDMLSPLAKLSDMALVGLMIATCAIRHEESRGAHFRRDFPKTDTVGKRAPFRLSELEGFKC
ncbi:MAG: L-aspartate oxidase [Bdellovibrionales bacterium]